MTALEDSLLTAGSMFIRLQSDVIVAKITSTINSIAPVSSQPEITIMEPQYISETTKGYNARWLQDLIGSLEYWKSYDTYKGEKRVEIVAKYKFPTWLSYGAWDARYLSTYLGWKFHLQARLVLPRDHCIFELAKTGNINGLQRVLAKYPGYITARKEGDGSNALHVSITSSTKRKLLIGLASLDGN